MNLEINHVSKAFEQRNEMSQALSDISTVVREKEFLCILGPSGCGKTTLLRMIAGLEPVSEGSITIDGEIISGPSRKMAMIFQDYSLYPWRTVIENIAFGLEIQDVDREKREKIAESYLDLIGLREFGKNYPYELSGGMRQRVAVARALAIDPSVLLMDEPFGALDAQTRNTLQIEILKIWEKTKKTVLFVTHSVDEAVFLADRIMVLTSRPGRIKDIVNIDLPRPRDRTSPDFAKIRRYVLSLIDEHLIVQ
jgi:NitT/TauT family transport system ATP-binding protein